MTQEEIRLLFSVATISSGILVLLIFLSGGFKRGSTKKGKNK